MAHDVFISYASLDKPTADAVCAALEAKGIRCWIAPRDILPGTDWSVAIIDAIEASRLMILVFSARANASNQIGRELERAVHKGLSIIPLRIEDVQPGRNLEYFLSTPHWLDALTPPMERHLEYLTETVNFLLSQGESPVAPPPSAPAITGALPLLKRREVLMGGGALAGLAAIAYVTGIFGGGKASELDSALIGSWQIQSGLTAASDGSSTDWTIQMAPTGSYVSSLIYKDAGRVKLLSPSAGSYLELTPNGAAGGYTRPVDWDQSGDTAKVLTASMMPSMMLQLVSSGTSINSMGAFITARDLWKRTEGSGSSLAGTWVQEADYGNMHWAMSFAVTSAGQYTFTGKLNDDGRITAKKGQWRQVSKVLGIQAGDYEIKDKDSILFRNDAPAGFAPTAQVIWTRAK